MKSKEYLKEMMYPKTFDLDEELNWQRKHVKQKTTTKQEHAKRFDRETWSESERIKNVKFNVIRQMAVIKSVMTAIGGGTRVQIS